MSAGERERGGKEGKGGRERGGKERRREGEGREGERRERRREGEGEKGRGRIVEVNISWQQLESILPTNTVQWHETK